MADRAKEYFKALQGAIEEENTDDIIDISTQILNFLPDDIETKVCRAVAYIQTDEYELAYADLEKVKGYEFEKAYCLFCLSRFTESLSIINSLPQNVQNENRFLHLRGQIYFHLESPECVQIYSEIQKHDDITEDDCVNISAAYALSGQPDQAEKILNAEASVQQIYNTAIAQVDSHNYARAQELITLGFSKVEKDSVEEQSFNILQALVNANQNQALAIETLNNLSENSNTNPYIRSIAACNYITLTVNSENSHLARKKVDKISDNDRLRKMRRSEQEAILINRFLVYYKIQASKAAKLLDLAKELPNISDFLLEEFSRTLDPSKAPKTVNAPIFDSQELINKEKYLDAANTLSSSSFSKRPRSIVAITELYAKTDISRAINYLKEIENDPALSHDAGFLEYASLFALLNEKTTEASIWAEKLMKIKSNDNGIKGSALFALSKAQNDIELAERYISRLGLDSETNQFNIQELESIQLQTTSKQSKSHLNNIDEKGFDAFSNKPKKIKRKPEDLTPEKLAKMKAKKRRRRRLQLPANYDPNRKVDPLRWTKKKKVSKGKKKALPPKVGKITVNANTPTPPPQQPKVKPAKSAIQQKKQSGKKKQSGRKGGW